MSRPNSNIFRFKQFDVDQTGCAMKINTDGVLLGALAGEGEPQTILDIGTGTGVIALMLAQRFPNAVIDAVEIDEDAAATAKRNFEASPYAERLNLFAGSFEKYFDQYPDKRYDLVVSNPPFYIDALTSPTEKKNQAKHAGVDFFNLLVDAILHSLNKEGFCWMILPVNTAELVKNIALQNQLHLQKQITIKSFTDEAPHREIVCFGFGKAFFKEEDFVIYQSPKIHSKQYEAALKNFFTIF